MIAGLKKERLDSMGFDEFCDYAKEYVFLSFLECGKEGLFESIKEILHAARRFENENSISEKETSKEDVANRILNTVIKNSNFENEDVYENVMTNLKDDLDILIYNS